MPGCTAEWSSLYYWLWLRWYSHKNLPPNAQSPPSDGLGRVFDKAKALQLGHTSVNTHRPKQTQNCCDINTHVHELHVGFRTGGLIEDFNGHRDLHCLTFWDPDALEYTSNHHKCSALSLNKHGDVDGYRLLFNDVYCPANIPLQVRFTQTSVCTRAEPIPLVKSVLS